MAIYRFGSSKVEKSPALQDIINQVGKHSKFQRAVSDLDINPREKGCLISADHDSILVWNKAKKCFTEINTQKGKYQSHSLDKLRERIYRLDLNGGGQGGSGAPRGHRHHHGRPYPAAAAGNGSVGGGGRSVGGHGGGNGGGVGVAGGHGCPGGAGDATQGELAKINEQLAALKEALQKIGNKTPHPDDDDDDVGGAGGPGCGGGEGGDDNVKGQIAAIMEGLKGLQASIDDLKKPEGPAGGGDGDDAGKIAELQGEVAKLSRALEGLIGPQEEGDDEGGGEPAGGGNTNLWGTLNALHAEISKLTLIINAPKNEDDTHPPEGGDGDGDGDDRFGGIEGRLGKVEEGLAAILKKLEDLPKPPCGGGGDDGVGAAAGGAGKAATVAAAVGVTTQETQTDEEEIIIEEEEEEEVVVVVVEQPPTPPPSPAPRPASQAATSVPPLNIFTNNTPATGPASPPTPPTPPTVRRINPQQIREIQTNLDTNKTTKVHLEENEKTEFIVAEALININFKESSPIENQNILKSFAEIKFVIKEERWHELHKITQNALTNSEAPEGYFVKQQNGDYVWSAPKSVNWKKGTPMGELYQRLLAGGESIHQKIQIKYEKNAHEDFNKFIQVLQELVQKNINGAFIGKQGQKQLSNYEIFKNMLADEKKCPIRDPRTAVATLITLRKKETKIHMKDPEQIRVKKEAMQKVQDKSILNLMRTIFEEEKLKQKKKSKAAAAGSAGGGKGKEKAAGQKPAEPAGGAA